MGDGDVEKEFLKAENVCGAGEKLEDRGIILIRYDCRAELTLVLVPGPRSVTCKRRIFPFRALALTSLAAPRLTVG